MWKVNQTTQSRSVSGTASGAHDPMRTCVNVPGLSEGKLEREIAHSGFSTGSDIQLKMLESAHLANPDCNWWLKGDRCDVVGGLGESTRFVWSGDVDHNDGEVQKMYQTYRNLLDFIASMRTITCDTVANLKKCSALLLQEKEFLVKAIKNAQKIYVHGKAQQ
ncbi:uncharacterized protein LOC135341643 isoform X2 [Halichondria panicea]|uniref:uncharacterized protein LOC135341643 isoform X2 n=1 Tax=Halichondria panicea TaxID=6063 RepID=UPI00312B91AD